MTVPKRLRKTVFLETGRQEISPVVYTCGGSVLEGLRRTKAVLGGL